MEREADTVDALVPCRSAGELDVPLPPGAALGPYRVVRVLGEGGMGRVYLAVHEVIGRRVALKVLRHRLTNDPRAVGRFFVEAQVVNRIRHPGIVEVTDLFVVAGMPCIVMELLEGRTFGAAIEEGELALDDVLDICAQIADALHAAHEAGVVHRDLKPDNVLLVPPGPWAGRIDDRRRRWDAKVLDFGIALLAGPNCGGGGAIMGTPEYMAPEQLTGVAVDARADIYALGISLFYAATGVLPFSGVELRDVVHKQLHAQPPCPSDVGDVGGALEDLILSMLAKNPAHRPASMAGVARVLRALRPAPALPPRAHAAFGAAAMMLVAAIGAAAWLGQEPVARAGAGDAAVVVHGEAAATGPAGPDAPQTVGRLAAGREASPLWSPVAPGTSSSSSAGSSSGSGSSGGSTSAGAPSATSSVLAAPASHGRPPLALTASRKVRSAAPPDIGRAGPRERRSVKAGDKVGAAAKRRLEKRAVLDPFAEGGG